MTILIRGSVRAWIEKLFLLKLLDSSKKSSESRIHQKLLDEKRIQAMGSDAKSRTVPLAFSGVQTLCSPTESYLPRFYQDFPYMCRTCGRRFNSHQLLGQHHDMHFKKNMEVMKHEGVHMGEAAGSGKRRVFFAKRVEEKYSR